MAHNASHWHVVSQHGHALLAWGSSASFYSAFLPTPPPHLRFSRPTRSLPIPPPPQPPILLPLPLQRHFKRNAQQLASCCGSVEVGTICGLCAEGRPA